MKESAARARAVSILKHRLNHRSAVSTPAIIGVGSNIEDANPITDQNAETGADRNSLFFGRPSRHPTEAQEGELNGENNSTGPSKPAAIAT